MDLRINANKNCQYHDPICILCICSFLPINFLTPDSLCWSAAHLKQSYLFDVQMDEPDQCSCPRIVNQPQVLSGFYGYARNIRLKVDLAVNKDGKQINYTLTLEFTNRIEFCVTWTNASTPPVSWYTDSSRLLYTGKYQEVKISLIFEYFFVHTTLCNKRGSSVRILVTISCV